MKRIKKVIITPELVDQMIDKMYETGLSMCYIIQIFHAWEFYKFPLSLEQKRRIEVWKVLQMKIGTAIHNYEFNLKEFYNS